MIQNVTRRAACAAGAVALVLALAGAMPNRAGAMTGASRAPDASIAGAVTIILGSRGNFCTATLIAPTLLLTAAHCVPKGLDYKLLQKGRDGAPQLLDIARVAVHPQFDMQSLLGHRATADVALLKLAAPLANARPARIGTVENLAPGARFTVAGGGLATRGDGRTGGTIRAADLIATGRPGTLQIRLVDPATGGTAEGAGACTGDSGAPAFQMQNGVPVVIGVVSWSTGANAGAGCGGLTGITPLTLYRDWITRAMRDMGATP